MPRKILSGAIKSGETKGCGQVSAAACGESSAWHPAPWLPTVPPCALRLPRTRQVGRPEERPFPRSTCARLQGMGWCCPVRRAQSPLLAGKGPCQGLRSARRLGLHSCHGAWPPTDREGPPGRPGKHPTTEPMGSYSPDLQSKELERNQTIPSSQSHK